MQMLSFSAATLSVCSAIVVFDCHSENLFVFDRYHMYVRHCKLCSCPHSTHPFSLLYSQQKAIWNCSKRIFFLFCCLIVWLVLLLILSKTIQCVVAWCNTKNETLDLAPCGLHVGNASVFKYRHGIDESEQWAWNISKWVLENMEESIRLIGRYTYKYVMYGICM